MICRLYEKAFYFPQFFFGDSQLASLVHNTTRHAVPVAQLPTAQGYVSHRSVSSTRRRGRALPIRVERRVPSRDIVAFFRGFDEKLRLFVFVVVVVRVASDASRQRRTDDHDRDAGTSGAVDAASSHDDANAAITHVRS